MSPIVKCNVNTCTHWVKGDLCGARNIDILHEEEGNMAQIAQHTECKTFEGKRGLANMLGSMDNVNWMGLMEEMVMPGKQLTPTVTCIVDSCKYWAKGNLCGADQINITGHNAKECQDTNCQTFENNGR